MAERENGTVISFRKSVLLGGVVYFAALKAARIQAVDEMTELVRETSKPYVESLVAKMPFLGKTISLLSNLTLGGK